MPSLNDPPLTYDDEFGRLEEAGMSSSYVEIKNGHVRPLLTLAQALAQGFFPKGTKVVWGTNENGYPYERERAEQTFSRTEYYTVKSCEIGSSSSIYEFEEVEGRWNTVMFEKALNQS